MNFFIDFADNSSQVFKETQEQVCNAIEEIAKKYVEKAKENVPVDTGNLRDSISYEVDGDHAEVGTDVEYAAAVELKDSTHRVGKSHFLRDAGQNNVSEFEKIARDELSK